MVHRAQYPSIVINGVEFLDVDPEHKGEATQLVRDGDIERAYPAVLKLGRPSGMISGPEMATVLKDGLEAVSLYVFKCLLFAQIHQAMIETHNKYWEDYYQRTCNSS